MWLTVLVLSIVATADPVRIGVSVALSSRPRAVGSLVAFWVGGIAASALMAAGVLFGGRDFALAAMHRVQLATATPTASHIQIAMGVVALLIAGVSVGIVPRQCARLGLPDDHSSELRLKTSAIISRMSTRARDALQARPLGVSFALGMGLLVDFRFLAALTAIVASGVAIRTQVSAAGLYTLIALAFVELPLVSQLAAPAKTDQLMFAMNRWAKARRQQVFALAIGLLGVFLVTRGIDHA